MNHQDLRGEDALIIVKPLEILNKSFLPKILSDNKEQFSESLHNMENAGEAIARKSYSEGDFIHLKDWEWRSEKLKRTFRRLTS